MLVSRARKGRRVNARERHGVLENTVATPALLLHPGLATLRADVPVHWVVCSAVGAASCRCHHPPPHSAPGLRAPKR